MKQILSSIRKAVEDYNMIEEGDKIAVALSTFIIKSKSAFQPLSFFPVRKSLTFAIWQILSNCSIENSLRNASIDFFLLSVSFCVFERFVQVAL